MPRKNAARIHVTRAKHRHGLSSTEDNSDRVLSAWNYGVNVKRLTQKQLISAHIVQSY